MEPLFDIFSLFDPHGRYQAEEMVTFQESEKTNHYPNYISKTTQFSTAFCFKYISDFNDLIGESKPISLGPWNVNKDYVIKDIDMKNSGKRRRTDKLAVKELKTYRRDGFTKIRLRDLSYRAKEYLGLLPPTNKNNKEEEYVAYSEVLEVLYPSSTHAAKPTTTILDRSARLAATARIFCPPSSTAKFCEVNATTYFGTIYWEVETILKSFDDLPKDVVATILAKLPTKDIYHGRSVCKAWDSIITTDLSFRSAFNESSNEYSFHRRPWFLLLDMKKKSSLQLQPEAVYDMEADAWCQIRLKIPVPRTSTTRTHSVVISSGGLMCVWSGSNQLTVSNPFTASSHRLPLLSDSEGDHYFKGMAMHVLPYSESKKGKSYQVFLLIAKKADKGRVLRIKTYASSFKEQEQGDWKEILELDLNPSKTGRLAGVTTIGRQGQVLLYFMSGDGSTAICWDVYSGTNYITPKILPQHQYCKASELVVCHGTLFAVILSGDKQQPRPYGPTQLQIFEFSDDETMNENSRKKWRHVTTMPEKIPQRYRRSGKDHDHSISCDGDGDYIMVCVTFDNSKFTTRSNYAVMFNNKEKVWDLLPPHRNCPPGHTGLTRQIEIHAFSPGP